MKKNLLILFLLSTAFAGKAQNIVPNGDFETHTACPSSYGQVSYATNWSIPSGGTTDYFNQCAISTAWSVPDNLFGYQPGHSGDAYCGMVGYGLSNWREYIEVVLTAPLNSNQCYHLQFYISLADDAQYTSDALGAYFSDILISNVPGTGPLLFTPQIDFNLGLNPDTANWILVSGTFTASGGENYLIIGNYKDDVQTNSLFLNTVSGFPYSYFYIDDVSLTPCTGITENTNSNSLFSIYPNPVKDELKIQNAEFKIKEIKIFNVLGEQVLQSAITNPQSAINVQSLKSGIYFIEINTGKNIFRKKFLKE